MFNAAEPLPLLSLLLVALALVTWIYYLWRRTHYTFLQAVLYLINIGFTRLLWRTKVTGGPLPIAPNEGAVIVCNHRSGIDPLLIQLATKRVVHWLVAREYVQHWSMAWAFRILQSIPVNRGGVDTASTKQAIRLAQEGGLVGLFPEGRVNVSGDLMLPGRPGEALIALKARVNVIPCFVSGSPYNGTALGSFLMRAKAKVIVGRPIDLSPYFDQANKRDVQEELTKRIMVEIAKLGGVHDYEPAGRRWKWDEEEEVKAES